MFVRMYSEQSWACKNSSRKQHVKANQLTYKSTAQAKCAAKQLEPCTINSSSVLHTIRQFRSGLTIITIKVALRLSITRMFGWNMLSLHATLLSIPG